MNQVFEEIERMGAYDPLVIQLNKNQFYKVGWMICCNGHLSLDKKIFNEGQIIQHPNSKTNWKIKSVSPIIKYSKFKII